MIPENEFTAFMTEYKADINAFFRALINFFKAIFAEDAEAAE